MLSRLAARKHGLLWARGRAFAHHSETIYRWPDEPASLNCPNSTSGPNSRPIFQWSASDSGSWKQPFSSRLTNVAAANFTNLAGSVEQGYTAVPVVEDTLASHLSPHGSPAPSFRLSRVGPFSLLSGSPTLQLIRQAWPSTLLPSSKPTRRISSRKWMRGPVWLLRRSRSCAKPSSDFFSPERQRRPGLVLTKHLKAKTSS